MSDNSPFDGLFSDKKSIVEIEAMNRDAAKKFQERQEAAKPAADAPVATAPAPTVAIAAPAVAPAAPASEKKQTDEQKAIVAVAGKLETAKAIAGAGAAKTTTLVFAAEANPNKKFAFLVYNKAAETDAKARFPKNVSIHTAHGFAFRELGGSFGDKIQRKPFPEAVARTAGLGEDSRAGVAILQAISKFCLSTDTEFKAHHFVDKEDFRALLEPAAIVWQKMSDPEDDFPATHDVYLKVWAMSGPKPKFDMLFVDEAQDMWPAISDAVHRMQLPSIYVGDPYQQIYSFRGAVNALDSIRAQTLPLTLSWRFGEKIADLANDILALRSELNMKAPQFKLRGQPTLKSEWHIGNEATPRLKDGSFAYLCRTNAGIIQAALASGKSSINIVGGGDEVLNSIADAWRLKSGEKPVTHEMRRYRTWAQFEAMSEIDIECKLAVKLIDEHGSKLPGILKDIRARTVPEAKADMILSSIHRSKGREWDEVAIGGDVPSIAALYKRQKNIELRGGKFDPTKMAEEINLLYVAATRAKKLMRVPSHMAPDNIKEAIAEADENNTRQMNNVQNSSPVLRKIGGYTDARPKQQTRREAPAERSVMDNAGWSGDRANDRGGWRFR